MAAQGSSTIGLFPAVEPSLVLTHRPDAAFRTRYLPAAAVEAVNVQSWLALVASPQFHCWSWVPDVVDELGTSMHLVLLTFTRLYWPVFRATTFHC